MAMHGAGFLRVNPTAAIRAGSNFGPYTENGEWWRLLSSVFIHFSLAHIFFNMLVLVEGGKVVERMVGSVRFLGIYLFAGVTGSLISLLWHPTVNSAGASGAIFGVFGAVVAYLVRYNRQVPRSIYLRHSRLAIVFIGYNLLFGFTHQGIDNGAHLGGLFGGFILGLVLAPAPDAVRESKERRWFAFGLAGTLAFGLGGGLTWALADLAARPDRHEILQFRRVVYESSTLEKSALTDIKSLHPASRSALALNAYALDIRTRLLPVWAQLRETIVDLHLPDGSPELKLQRGLLSYYGDVSMSLEMAADMASDPRKQTSAGSAAAIAMMKKAMQERIELIRQGGVS
jgi:rhomboid protease GluP